MFIHIALITSLLANNDLTLSDFESLEAAIDWLNDQMDPPEQGYMMPFQKITCLRRVGMPNFAGSRTQGEWSREEAGEIPNVKSCTMLKVVQEDTPNALIESLLHQRR